MWLQITGGGTCFYKASMSTHRGTNVLSRLLLHVLRVETAPLVEAGRKVNTGCWLQITGGGTCFYKASMSTHRDTNVISRLLLHVPRVETASLVEAGRKGNRRWWLQITGGTCFYKASMSTHRGTNVFSRLLLHVLRVETAPLVEARRKVNRRCWLQITGGGTCFYKASLSTHRGTNVISRLLLHVETAPLVEAGRKVNRRCWLQITGGGTCFYKASLSTHRGTNVISRLLLHVETAPLVEAGRKVNRRCWQQITGGGTCFYKASMSTHRGTNLISRLLLHVLEAETAPVVEAGRKVNTGCWLQITGGGTCFYKASMSTHRGTNVFSWLLLHVLRVETAPLVEAGRKVNMRCWLQITGGGTCFYKASMSTHRDTNVISRLLLHVPRVETAPLVEAGRKGNRRWWLQITGGTCFYKASMSTHRGTNVFSRLLLHVLRVETAPLVEAGRKVNTGCWLQITGGGTCFYKASMSTHRGTNLISRLLLHVLEAETAPVVEAGRKVNTGCWLQITGGGTCFYKASMSTHRGTNVFSWLLLHVLRVETPPLVEAGRKVNMRCWLQITGGGTCFYKASMSTHRDTNVISRLLLHVLEVETAPLVEAGRKVNRRCGCR